MIYILVLLYFAIGCALYFWLRDSQYASAFSRFGLFLQCQFWLPILLFILIMETYYSFKPIASDLQKWEDLKPADPGPHKPKVDPNIRL